MRPDEKKKEINKIEEPQPIEDKAYDQTESQEVNKDIEIQNLKQEIQNLKANNEEKDKVIRAQASQLNIQISKNNKLEITVDALQDKLLSIINSIK